MANSSLFFSFFSPLTPVSFVIETQLTLKISQWPHSPTGGPLKYTTVSILIIWSVLCIILEHSRNSYSSPEGLWPICEKKKIQKPRSLFPEAHGQFSFTMMIYQIPTPKFLVLFNFHWTHYSSSPGREITYVLPQIVPLASLFVLNLESVASPSSLFSPLLLNCKSFRSRRTLRSFHSTLIISQVQKLKSFLIVFTLDSVMESPGACAKAALKFSIFPSITTLPKFFCIQSKQNKSW